MVKKILYLILFISATAKAQVNFSTYGVTYNDGTDDTAAVQAAFDAGVDLFADTDGIIVVTDHLDIDAAGDQTIEWNNALIESNIGEKDLIHVDKPSGLLTMNNLRIDGNDNTRVGIYMFSPTNMTNVDITELYGALGATYAFRVAMSAKLTQDMTLIGCDATEIDALDNWDPEVGNIGDPIGATRAWVISYDDSTSLPPSDLLVTIKDCLIDGVLSEDGDGISMDDQYPGQTANALEAGQVGSRVLWENVTMRRCARRTFKLLAGGVTVRNCLVQGADPALDPRINASGFGPAGLFGTAHTYDLGAASFARTTNIVIDGNTFEGTPYQNITTVAMTDGFYFVNNTLKNGIDLNIQQAPAVVNICNNTFEAGSEINDGGPLYDYVTASLVRVHPNNTFADGPSAVQVDQFNLDQTAFDCSYEVIGSPGGGAPVETPVSGSNSFLISH